MSSLFIKKRLISLILYIFLAVIIFCFWDIYFLSYQTVLSRVVSKVIPYPALIINSDLVTVGQYDNFSVRYQSYLTELGHLNNLDHQSLLKIMIQNIALKQIGAKLDINFNQEEFNNYITSFYENNRVLPIDQEKFNNYFLKPNFYKQKIIEKISADQFNLENKKKIKIIYGDLLIQPESFTDYSYVYKDSELGINGNFLAWLSFSNLPESLRLKVEKMEVGDFTSVIKSISGYHIYKLNGKIENEDGNYYYQFDQIFLPIKNFNNYLSNFLENSKILYFLNR